jgi:hypothetical protein
VLSFGKENWSQKKGPLAKPSPKMLHHQAEMPRVFLNLQYDATSGATVAALRVAMGRCPECCDPELPGWMVPSGPEAWILPEEPESQMLRRMCLDCSNDPSSFCGGECLRISYGDFHQGHWEASCAHCNATMASHGEAWAATCTRCEGSFCSACVARVRACER